MPQPLIVSDQLGQTYALIVNSTDMSMTLTPVSNVSPSTPDNSVFISALSLIASALRLINVQASGEPVEINAANDSLMVLNQMLDSWNADRASIFTTRADDYPFVVNKQSYTLGPGGDFNANRPAQIDGMSAILLTNLPYPVEIPMDMYTVADWQLKVPMKNVSSSFPLICYDDGGFPQRTLNFWPIPNQANSVRIYSWQGLGLVPNLNSLLNFPAGYAEAFRYNLAGRLSAEFAAALPPIVQQIAVESLARVKTMNAPDLQMRSDLSPNVGGYNWKADQFGLPF